MLPPSSRASPCEDPSPTVKLYGLNSTPDVTEMFTLLDEFKVNE